MATEKLKSWDCIVAKSVQSFLKILKQHVSKDFIKIILKDGYLHWIGYVDETVFDVNVLSITEDKVICTGADKEVFASIRKAWCFIHWKFRLSITFGMVEYIA